MKKHVCVAMSGGVDSSVAAALLLHDGYSVCGVTMRLPCGKDSEGQLLYRDDDKAIADAAQVASVLGIPHHVVEIKDIFQKEIVTYFTDEYFAGRTPNPCVRCNRVIKFGYLLDTAKELGCDLLATGHYARIENSVLKKGFDSKKDQSYFLYGLYATEIDSILFPLGTLNKEQVRARAVRDTLPVSQKQESQDICFIPDGDYLKFLGISSINSSGPIVDTSGKRIGTHQGIYRYTVGQRKGLGAFGKPVFVKQINPQENSIVIASDSELFSDSVFMENWVGGPLPLECGKEYAIRIRYRSSAVPCVIEKVENQRVEVRVLKPVRAVAPGQAAVVYDGDCVVGGGTIVL